MPEVIGLPEIGELTTKLGESLNQLHEAKSIRDTILQHSKEATENYRRLFELVEALQREIHDAISVCLKV